METPYGICDGSCSSILRLHRSSCHLIDRKPGGPVHSWENMAKDMGPYLRAPGSRRDLSLTRLQTVFESTDFFVGASFDPFFELRSDQFFRK
jgi:hypothetical protein